MEYYKLLQNSYKVMTEIMECRPESHLEYLADYIFDFTTYDRSVAELLASKAVEVCEAITDGTTFEYIKDEDNYRWYLLMCNMPFFSERIEWGTSIRGAWWDYEIVFHSCGLWHGDAQITDDLKFTQEEWKGFMREITNFANVK